MDSSNASRGRSLLPFAAAVLLAVSLAASAGAAEGARRYLVDTWGTDAGLPQNSVPAIAQTPDGFLWVATFNGLVRFDGHRFRTFTATDTPGLASDNINVLATDPRGRLWIGTDDAGLSLFDGQRFVAYRATNSTGSLRIANLAVRADGTAWIGTADGLLHFDGHGFTPPPADGDFAEVGRVNSMHADPEGRIWIGSSTGLYRLDGDQLRRDPRLTGPTGVSPGRGGSILAFSPASGIWRLTGETGTAIPGTIGIPCETVAETRPDEFWLLSPPRSLLLHAAGRITEFQDSHGIAHERLSTIFADADGHLWAGANGGGLHRLHRQALVNLTTADGLPSDDVVCLLEQRPGRVWTGMYGGGTTVWESGRFAQPAGLPGPDSTVYALALDRDRSIWLGTPESTLWHWQDGEPPSQRPTDAEGSRVILRARSGALWLGSKYGGVVREHDGVSHRFSITNGLAHAYVTAIAEGPDDAVWVGTKHGLHRIVGDSVTRFTRADGLGADTVHTLFMDAGGVLWIGTAGGGLSRWKNGQFRTLTREHGLPDNVVAQLLDDGLGHLWIGSNRGLFRVRRQLLDAVADGLAPRLQGLRLGRTDGMSNPECAGSFQSSCFRAQDGRLWFATVGGIVVVDPADLPPPATPPPVHLLAVFADGREMPLRQESPGHPLRRCVAPPGTARTEFEFTAVSFSTPDQVRFRFRLHGIDPAWVSAHEHRTATYTGLAPGEYPFEVTAASPEGDWNATGASLTLVIPPFWWQTLPFRLAVAFATVGGLGFVAWALLRSHLRRKLEAARRQQEQDHSRALAETNRTLAARSRELEEALANVKVLSGLIPICASCKKIRDDQGFWNQVEKYIQQHTDARFSHGLCPDCLATFYPELEDAPPPQPPSPTITGS